MGVPILNDKPHIIWISGDDCPDDHLSPWLRCKVQSSWAMIDFASTPASPLDAKWRMGRGPMTWSFFFQHGGSHSAPIRNTKALVAWRDQIEGGLCTFEPPGNHVSGQNKFEPWGAQERNRINCWLRGTRRFNITPKKTWSGGWFMMIYPLNMTTTIRIG